jgi:hypothetical protein
MLLYWFHSKNLTRRREGGIIGGGMGGRGIDRKGRVQLINLCVSLNSQFPCSCIFELREAVTFSWIFPLLLGFLADFLDISFNLAGMTTLSQLPYICIVTREEERCSEASMGAAFWALKSLRERR